MVEKSLVVIVVFSDFNVVNTEKCFDDLCKIPGLLGLRTSLSHLIGYLI